MPIRELAPGTDLLRLQSVDPARFPLLLESVAGGNSLSRWDLLLLGDGDGLRLEADGRVQRCHLRDASWFQWPLLEAAIEGNIVADFPLCNKSFNCSYSGHDL